jgi:hypothetical protein
VSNEPSEAYTGKHVGHRGTHVPEAWNSSVNEHKADGHGVNEPEANTKESLYLSN